jgi:hypothetical protein
MDGNDGGEISVGILTVVAILALLIGFSALSISENLFQEMWGLLSILTSAVLFSGAAVTRSVYKLRDELKQHFQASAPRDIRDPPAERDETRTFQPREQ